MVSHQNPPLVLVVDNNSIRMLLFPFKNKEGEPLVNCLVLPSFQMFIDNQLNTGLIELIIRLSNKDCNITDTIDNFQEVDKKN
jgi:hypothetical protein